jgi:hypothetical protein
MTSLAIGYWNLKEVYASGEGVEYKDKENHLGTLGSKNTRSIIR